MPFKQNHSQKSSNNCYEQFKNSKVHYNLKYRKTIFSKMRLNTSQVTVSKFVKWLLKRAESKIDQNISKEDRRLKSFVQNNVTTLLSSLIGTIQDHGTSIVITKQYNQIKYDDEPINSQTVQKAKLCQKIRSLKSISLKKGSQKSSQKSCKQITFVDLNKHNKKYVSSHQIKIRQKHLKSVRMSISYKNTRKHISISSIGPYQSKHEAFNSKKSIATPDKEIDLIRKRKGVSEFLSLAERAQRNQIHKLAFKSKSILYGNQPINKSMDVQQQNDNQVQTFEHLNAKVQGKINDQIIINNKKQEQPQSNQDSLVQQKIIKTLTTFSQFPAYLRSDKLASKNLETHPLNIPKEKLQPGVKIRIQSKAIENPLKKKAHSLNSINKKSSFCIPQSKFIKISKTEQSSKLRQRKSKNSIDSEQNLFSGQKNLSSRKQSQAKGLKNYIKIQDHILYQELVCVKSNHTENEEQFDDQHIKNQENPLKSKKSAIEDLLVSQYANNARKKFKSKKKVELEKQNIFIPLLQIVKSASKYKVQKELQQNFEVKANQKQRVNFIGKNILQNNRSILSKPKFRLKL